LTDSLHTEPIVNLVHLVAIRYGIGRNPQAESDYRLAIERPEALHRTRPDLTEFAVISAGIYEACSVERLRNPPQARELKTTLRGR
jgi:hypothetical protein